MSEGGICLRLIHPGRGPQSSHEPAEYWIQNGEAVSNVKLVSDAKRSQVCFRRGIERGTVEGNTALARFQYNSTSSIVLEPLSEGVSVQTIQQWEADPSDPSEHALTIPPSTHGQQNFVYLRPDDVVLVKSLDSAVHIMQAPTKQPQRRIIAEANGNDSILHDAPNVVKAEIQVRSSGHEMDDTIEPAADSEKHHRDLASPDEDTEDDEEDLDVPRSRLDDVKQTAPPTPVSSNRFNHECTNGEATIEETPTKGSGMGEEQLFSTAPIHPEDECTIEIPSLSAAARVFDLGKNSSDGRAGGRLLSSIDQTPTSSMPKDGTTGEVDLSKREETPDATANPSKSPSASPKDRESPIKLIGNNSTFLKRKISTEITMDEEDEDATGSSKKRRTISPSIERSPSSPLVEAIRRQTEDRGSPEAAQSPNESLDEIMVASRNSSVENQSAKRTSSPKVIVESSRASVPPKSTQSPASTKISKVVLSSLNLDTRMINWLKSKGVHVVEDDLPTSRSQYICVVSQGNLRKTSKVLRSLIAGKYVVTERWLKESKKAGRLLHPGSFVHEELKHAEIGSRSRLFAGKKLVFTSALVKQYGPAGWEDIMSIVQEAGGHAEKCKVLDHDLGIDDKENHDAVIFLGREGDDEVRELIEKHDRIVFQKDFLTETILSGDLDLTNEDYRLSGNAAASKKRSRH